MFKAGGEGSGPCRVSPAGLLVRIANGIVNVVILLLAVLLIGYGVFSIWDNNRILNQASAKSYETYRPAEEKDSPSFAQLQAMNPDVLGWISIYGTGIDYPLVQGKDNDEYLNRDIDGSFRLSGSIFLDSTNARDFSDFNTIIYGHHMVKDRMFGDLDKFTDQSFFDSHRYGSLYYGGRMHGLEIFAMVEADAYDFELYNPQVGESAGARQSYLDQVLRKASWSRECGVGPGDHVVMLSTCAGNTNGRYVVFARITDTVPKNSFAQAGNSVFRSVTGTESPLRLLVLIAVLVAGILFWLAWRGRRRTPK